MTYDEWRIANYESARDAQMRRDGRIPTLRRLVDQKKFRIGTWKECAMPIICEDGRHADITPDEAAFLIALRVVETCSDCGQLHHEEYERWDEVDRLLQTRRQVLDLPTP